MSTVFEMVKYHKREYPEGIPLRIEEVACHFDIQSINPSMDYSLHTEYSYGKRKYNTELISQFPELTNSNRDGIPQLWKNEKWAEEFSNYIITLAKNNSNPRVIEIHSPFNDYTDIDGFVRSYRVFEQIIHAHFPDTEILIENRCGSVYRGGKFLFSKVQDIEALCNEIQKNDLLLRIAYDIPQVYTAHFVKTADKYVDILKRTETFRDFIGGVHLWGKKISESGRKIAHSGDLNTYFNDSEVKAAFLQAFKECFNDGVARKMVLEVNSRNDDLKSIIIDLLTAGVTFV